MTTVKKSDLLKYLKNNYVNFLSKDLEKLLNIIFNEIKQSLKKGERVELRDSIGTFSTKKQAEKRNARNPKTGESGVYVPPKRIIHYRMSKKLFLKLNEKK